MKKKKWNRLFSVLFVMVTVISLLSGCGRKSAEKEDAETITVYLWTTQLYEKYAPYIQKQLPDINIEFVVGNNDLDFYRFLNENGGLPDIITCCRFSLHDASPLKDSLMDLSTTNEAGAVYNTDGLSECPSHYLRAQTGLGALALRYRLGRVLRLGPAPYGRLCRQGVGRR